MINTVFKRRVDSISLWNNKSYLASTILLLSPLNNIFSDAGYRSSVGARLVIMAALIYFVLPADVTFDFIPAIGYIDDYMVAALALRLCGGEVDRYIEFKTKTLGLD